MIYFGYFSFSYLSGVDKTDTFIRSRGSLENHTRFQTIMVKIDTRFQTKTAQKPYHVLWGGTYLYSRRPVAQLFERRDCCAGGLGFEPQTGPTLRVLK